MKIKIHDKWQLQLTFLAAPTVLTGLLSQHDPFEEKQEEQVKFLKNKSRQFKRAQIERGKKEEDDYVQFLLQVSDWPATLPLTSFAHLTRHHENELLMQQRLLTFNRNFKKNKGKKQEEKKETAKDKRNKRSWPRCTN